MFQKSGACAELFLAETMLRELHCAAGALTPRSVAVQSPEGFIQAKAVERSQELTGERNRNSGLDSGV